MGRKKKQVNNLNSRRFDDPLHVPSWNGFVCFDVANPFGCATLLQSILKHGINSSERWCFNPSRSSSVSVRHCSNRCMAPYHCPYIPCFDDKVPYANTSMVVTIQSQSCWNSFQSQNPECRSELTSATTNSIMSPPTLSQNSQLVHWLLASLQIR